jgi:hypothetical protein
MSPRIAKDKGRLMDISIRTAFLEKPANYAEVLVSA